MRARSSPVPSPPALRAVPIAAAAAAAALLASCAGASSGATIQAGGSGPSAVNGGALGAVPGLGGAQFGVAQQSTAGGAASSSASRGATLDIGTTPGKIERKVDATFRIPHGDFHADFDLVVNRGTELGGFVVDSTTQNDADGRLAGGTVTIRVPAEKLSQLVSGFSDKEFEVSGINYSSVDHTAETVDLAARLKAAIGHRDALSQLLARAQNLQEITSLEDQITQVQQQIDQIQGQSDAVATAVELATARITLTERDIVAPPPATPSPILDAVRTGWSNVVSVVAFTVLAILTVLPVLALAVLAMLVLPRLAPVRSRRGTPPPPPPPAAGLPPAGPEGAAA